MSFEKCGNVPLWALSAVLAAADELQGIDAHLDIGKRSVHEQGGPFFEMLARDLALLPNSTQSIQSGLSWP
ncbi:MAG: hypothetical protein GY765_15115 [bacterium]|nr:hypothetical protein [bacterium]